MERHIPAPPGLPQSFGERGKQREPHANDANRDINKVSDDVCRQFVTPLRTQISRHVLLDAINLGNRLCAERNSLINDTVNMTFFLVKMSAVSSGNCPSDCNGHGLCVGGSCVCEVQNPYDNPILTDFK